MVLLSFSAEAQDYSSKCVQAGGSFVGYSCKCGMDRYIDPSTEGCRQGLQYSYSSTCNTSGPSPAEIQLSKHMAQFTYLQYCKSMLDSTQFTKNLSNDTKAGLACFCAAARGAGKAKNDLLNVVQHPIDSAIGIFKFIGSFPAIGRRIEEELTKSFKQYQDLTDSEKQAVRCHTYAAVGLNIAIPIAVTNSIKILARFATASEFTTGSGGFTAKEAQAIYEKATKNVTELQVQNFNKVKYANDLEKMKGQFRLGDATKDAGTVIDIIELNGEKVFIKSVNRATKNEVAAYEALKQLGFSTPYKGVATIGGERYIVSRFIEGELVKPTGATELAVSYANRETRRQLTHMEAMFDRLGVETSDFQVLLDPKGNVHLIDVDGYAFTGKSVTVQEKLQSIQRATKWQESIRRSFFPGQSVIERLGIDGL